jgi:hypothetical protein
MFEGMNDAGMLLMGTVVAAVIISGISLAYVSSVRKLMKRSIRLEQARYEDIDSRLPPAATNGKTKKKNGNGNGNHASNHGEEQIMDPLNPFAKKQKKKGGLFGKKNSGGHGEQGDSWQGLK